jgi:hypothetical protein
MTDAMEVFMSYPRIYTDFHNADPEGRLRLNCAGTLEDLSHLHIELKDGQPLTLHSEELEANGIVQYSDNENVWVASINWDAVKKIEEAFAAVG